MVQYSSIPYGLGFAQYASGFPRYFGPSRQDQNQPFPATQGIRFRQARESPSGFFHAQDDATPTPAASEPAKNHPQEVPIASGTEPTSNQDIITGNGNNYHDLYSSQYYRFGDEYIPIPVFEADFNPFHQHLPRFPPMCFPAPDRFYPLGEEETYGFYQNLNILFYLRRPDGQRFGDKYARPRKLLPVCSDDSEEAFEIGRMRASISFFERYRANRYRSLNNSSDAPEVEALERLKMRREQGVCRPESARGEPRAYESDKRVLEWFRRLEKHKEPEVLVHHDLFQQKCEIRDIHE